MPHCLRLMPDGTASQVWRFSDDEAVLLGITNPETGAGSYFKASEGRTVMEDIAERTPWIEMAGGVSPFVTLELPAGHYYPRLARPIEPSEDRPLWSPTADRNLVASSGSQVAVLAGELGRLCRTVHPSPANFQVFGHDIRNLLILAATEVEMHFRGVLAANGATKRQPNMNDYAVLGTLMKLEDYGIAFPAYPWLEPIRPFAGWKPGTGLRWWSAYNGVKHDRDTEFDRATLLHAFEAVTACVVLLAAQFGGAEALAFGDLARSFDITAAPEWPVGQSYCGFLSESGGEWVAVHHPELVKIVEPPRRGKRGREGGA